MPSSCGHPINAIGTYHRFGTLLVDESNDGFSDFWIDSRVGGVAESSLNRIGISTFRVR
jgi:hypothetical protein